MLQDLRYALRAVAKRRSYAVTTILVFTLGIGANTTVFSIYNGLFLRPLPYPHADRLVIVYDSLPKIGVQNGGTSIPNYVDRRKHVRALASLALVRPDSRTLLRRGKPEQISVARASPSLFSVLGIKPVLGRPFNANESTPGNDDVVILSYRLWTTRFGGKAAAISQKLRLDGRSYLVIGVMPKGFNFFNRAIDAWVPFSYTPLEASNAQRGQGVAISVGRLRAGATLEGLNTQLGAMPLPPQMAAFVRATGFTGRAEPLRDFEVGNLRQILSLLEAIVVTVLLIACANVANLQLSRVVSRTHELSVRTALGADHWRLVRLVLIESVVLAVVGGGAGLAFAYAGLELVQSLGLDRSMQGFALALDPTVLAFTGAVALLAALISALPPVIGLARDDLMHVVNETRRLGGGTSGGRIRGALVIVQLAASIAMLAGAGTLIEGFYHLQKTGPGFEAANVWSAAVTLPKQRYTTSKSQVQFYDQALESLGALPGIVEAGFTSVLPFSGEDSSATVAIDGRTAPAGSPPPVARLRTVDTDYFASLGIPILKGRRFDPTETEPVAIIDQTLAKKYWPKGNAIGHRVRAPSQDTWSTIVGVVPHVKYTSLAKQGDRPTIYWYYKQRPQRAGAFTLRSSLPLKQLAAEARAAISRIDPDVALYDTMPMTALIQRSLGPQRTPMVLAVIFGGIAFTLAVVGIYGVLASAVAMRVGEIGVRIALGAQMGDVVRMIVKQGARLIALALVFGVPAAIVVGRALSAELPYVAGLDPLVIAAAAAALAIASALASWLPARRASRIDAMRALREE